jgi:chromate transport protein ChrA
MDRKEILDLGFRFAILCLMGFGGVAALIPVH